MNEDLRHIYTAENHAELQRISALLSSLSIEWYEGETNRNEVWCHTSRAEEVTREIAKLRDEYNAPRLPQRTLLPINKHYFVIVFLLLIVTYFFQHFTTEGSLLLQNGRASASRISSGEFMRGMTALFLHIDPRHLAGNIVFGMLALWALSSLIGTGTAIFITIFGGMIGNIVNALLYGSAHNAIGFSTAVFASWGALGAIQLLPAFRRPKGRLWLPFAAALGMLAMLGSSVKSDVWAHFFGFFSGAALALVFGIAIRNRALPSSYGQRVLFVLSMVGIAVSWAVVILR